MGIGGRATHIGGVTAPTPALVSPDHDGELPCID
jgi:hypothetical protein